MLTSSVRYLQSNFWIPVSSTGMTPTAGSGQKRSYNYV
ncbi:MAG: hypothetical protein LKM45_05590 [Wolbachia endosymbiont of Alcedoecus sp.]|nr:hypothetical protein [Wolbachia endosymbiont of Alcedoecus sp.]MDG7053316.1 hypothetical protein [Wolbachia endosymbiont of Alcedoecus sp.]MDG7056793.1 hypothetical protein [Wolbachia endosymbiont of Penenirmus auritus]